MLARPRDDLKIPLDGDGLDELAVAVDGVRRRLGVCRLRPGLVVQHDSRHLACEHGVRGVEHVAQVLLGAHAAPRVLVVVTVGNGRRPQVAAAIGARRPRPSRRRRLALQLHIGAHEHRHKLDRVAIDEVDFGVAEQVDFVIVEHSDLAVKVRIVRIGELHFAQDALLVCHVRRVRRRRRRRRGDSHAHRRLWLVAVAVAEGADGAKLGVAVVVAVVVVARRHGDAEVQAPDAALWVGRILRRAIGPPARKVGVVLAVDHWDDNVAAAHFPHKARLVGVGLAANPPEVLALCHERRLDRVKLGGGASDASFPPSASQPSRAFPQLVPEPPSLMTTRLSKCVGENGGGAGGGGDGGGAGGSGGCGVVSAVQVPAGAASTSSFIFKQPDVAPPDVCVLHPINATLCEEKVASHHA